MANETVGVPTIEYVKSLEQRITNLEAGSVTPPDPPNADGAVFYDEFLGDAIDETKWNYGQSYDPPAGHAGGSDLQSFAINPKNNPANVNPYSVRDSILTITINPIPDKPEYAHRKYGAGFLCTEHKFSQQYGYMEARMKMHGVRGTLSAFWTLAEQGGWPPEIDITEVRGDSPNTNITTTHSNNGGNVANPQWQSMSDGSQNWHDYGCEWTHDRINWFVDRKQVSSGPTPGDFHTPMYIIFSNYAGADNAWFGGSIPSGTPMPQKLLIDWVKVWTAKPF